MDKYAVFPLMKYKLLLIRHFEQPTAFFCIRFFGKYYSKMAVEPIAIRNSEA